MATKSRSLNELMKAIEERRWDDVSEMCKAQPDLINKFAEDGKNTLIEAVRKGAPEEILLQIMEQANKKTLNTRDLVGLTILHWLARRGFTSALARALEISNDNINAQTYGGDTPLHLLLMNSELTYEKQKEMTKRLLDSGAITTIKNMDGETPIDYYKDNECWFYDENKREANKAELLLLLEGKIPEEIIARGSKAVQSYIDEVNSGETTMVNSRIMILGKEGAGKTSTVNTILGKKLNEEEPSTDGIVTTTVVQNVGKDCTVWEAHDVDVCELTKEIHDYAIATNVALKLERIEAKQNTSYEPPANNQASSASASAQQSSVASEAFSMTKTVKAKKSIKKGMYRVFRELKVFFMRTKIPESVHQKLVNILESKSTVDSPKDITSIWDYAGQLIYYITHRFYLTSSCVYCVVFSLLDNLDDKAKPRDGLPGKLDATNLEMIVFFTRSIYEHAVLRHGGEKRQLRDREIAFPPILLVGTHKDKLSGSEAEKLEEIEKIFSIIIDEIKKMPCKIHEHVDREIYAVDNNNPFDEGIQKLMKNAGAYMNGLVQTVPISWVNFQGKLQEAARTQLRMSLVEITKVAFECGISEKYFNTALNYLNDVGVILYSKTNKKLKDTVIINVHEMIGMMKTIITVFKALNIGATLEDSWDKLNEEGILEEKLLRHLWDDKIKQDASNLDVFLEVMKMFGLLFEKRPEQGKRIFLVPSRMQITMESLEVKQDDKYTASIYVTPTDFLSDAVYNVLVVGFLDFMEKKRRKTESKYVKLFQNRSDFDLYEDHHVRLGAVKIQNKRALKLEISHMPIKDEDGNEKNFEPQYSICIEVLTYLKDQLKSVYGTMQGVGYELCVCCDACNPVDEPLHKLDQCLENNVIRCGDKAVSTARFRRMFAGDGEARQPIEVTDAIPHQTDRSVNEKHEFRKFLAKLSKHYPANLCLWLRFLLSDFLPTAILSETNITGMYLFNELDSRGQISCTNVTLLYEICDVTEMLSAKQCVEAYKQKTPCKEGKGLTPFRKILFKSLMEVTDSDVHGLMDYYKLRPFQFDNVWDLVFHLEQHNILDKRQKWKSFAGCLNEKAKCKIIDCIEDDMQGMLEQIVTVEVQ